MNWKSSRVLVTGGASFIGSALVDALVERGAKVRVVDTRSIGRLDNIQYHVLAGSAELLEADLLKPGVAERSVKGIDVAFHLADHGGRGYADLHQVACSTNLILDGLFFRACQRAGIGKVVHASSGCVYANFKQSDPKQILYLTEDKAGPPYDADNMYS